MKKKVKLSMKAKPMATVYNNTPENDDWMKTLPDYKDEVAIHKKIALELAANKPIKKAVRIVQQQVL